ncbi:hypothetical protein WCLP8_260004 [uncultured Gammaproteobacteria bacterium]
MSDTYDSDFFAWTAQQAAALRHVAALRINLPEVDLEHLAEEIEDVGTEIRNACFSFTWRILEHLMSARLTWTNCISIPGKSR